MRTKIDEELACLLLWSGRVMPQDSRMRELPAMVAAAREMARSNDLVR